ncbi:MAG: shikimate kinase [Saprospiraceae bacterium]|nr:shikimate kinase [Pyrinomonadaceae bacterium]
MNELKRIALTGFMGVGKSSVARHLSYLLRCERIDLDNVIESSERRKIAQIIDSDGVEAYRRIETDNLKRSLQRTDIRILSLGGGAWTMPENRDLIREHGLTSVWLESTFNHCWNNIHFSKKDRPLARNKDSALKLFNERQEVYCLADWHFIVRPDLTSYDVAVQIQDEVFS